MSSIAKKINAKRIISRFVLRNHVYSAKVNRKVVAFTFDDGPSQETTTRLVDLFAQYQGKASFFFQGNRAELHSDIVLYAHRAGCSIGNHSYDHSLYDQIGASEMLRQIRKTNQILTSITGESPRFLRPPQHRFTQWEAIQIWLKTHQLIIEANLTPMDWTGLPPSDLADFLSANIQPGAIVCLHDASESTVQALQEALPRLKKMGYDFLSLAEMQKEGRFSPYRQIIVNNLK